MSDNTPAEPNPHNCPHGQHKSWTCPECEADNAKPTPITRLYGLPEAEHMEVDPYYVLDDQPSGTVIVEEWSVHPPIASTVRWRQADEHLADLTFEIDPDTGAVTHVSTETIPPRTPRTPR